MVAEIVILLECTIAYIDIYIYLFKNIKIDWMCDICSF